jgi:hypothetical protein
MLSSSTFWDITPWCPLKVKRHLGGTYVYCTHLHGGIVNKTAAGSKFCNYPERRRQKQNLTWSRQLLHAGCLLCYCLNPENEGYIVQRNVWGLPPDYAALYPITTAVRTSDPTSTGDRTFLLESFILMTFQLFKNFAPFTKPVCSLSLSLKAGAGSCTEPVECSTHSHIL